MNIRNIDFDFDILRAGDADRFDRAAREMQAAAQAVPRDSLGSIIRGSCAMLDNFLAEVLGEDYDARLGIDAEDLRQLQAIYADVLAAVGAAQKELQAFGTASAQTSLKAQAGEAAKAASQSLPQPAYTAEKQPENTAAEAVPDFAHMNRAQRRAWVKGLKGGK